MVVYRQHYPVFSPTELVVDSVSTTKSHNSTTADRMTDCQQSVGRLRFASAASSPASPIRRRQSVNSKTPPPDVVFPDIGNPICCDRQTVGLAAPLCNRRAAFRSRSATDDLAPVSSRMLPVGTSSSFPLVSPVVARRRTVREHRDVTDARKEWCIIDCDSERFYSTISAGHVHCNALSITHTSVALQRRAASR